MTINAERLAELPNITLKRGGHQPTSGEFCAMELVAYMAGEKWSAAPQCASPVLTSFVVSLNDRWDDVNRQRLAPFLPRIVGTRDGRDEVRSYMALDWLIRTYTPTWLDLAGLTVEAAELRGLRRIVDLVAAQSAGPVVRNAATKADAAWDAAGDAAWAAARVAAWDAAWDAARVAAGDAAWDALKPTVALLQDSALELLDTMIGGVL